MEDNLAPVLEKKREVFRVSIRKKHKHQKLATIRNRLYQDPDSFQFMNHNPQSSETQYPFGFKVERDEKSNFQKLQEGLGLLKAGVASRNFPNISQAVLQLELLIQFPEVLPAMADSQVLEIFAGIFTNMLISYRKQEIGTDQIARMGFYLLKISIRLAENIAKACLKIIKLDLDKLFRFYLLHFCDGKTWRTTLALMNILVDTPGFEKQFEEQNLVEIVVSTMKEQMDGGQIVDSSVQVYTFISTYFRNYGVEKLSLQILQRIQEAAEHIIVHHYEYVYERGMVEAVDSCLEILLAFISSERVRNELYQKTQISKFPYPSIIDILDISYNSKYKRSSQLSLYVLDAMIYFSNLAMRAICQNGPFVNRVIGMKQNYNQIATQVLSNIATQPELHHHLRPHLSNLAVCFILEKDTKIKCNLKDLFYNYLMATDFNIQDDPSLICALEIISKSYQKCKCPCWNKQFVMWKTLLMEKELRIIPPQYIIQDDHDILYTLQQMGIQ